MNLILEKSAHVKYYTYLLPIFEALPDLKYYYWMISDIELNFYPNNKFREDPVFIRGEELFSFIA